jgi:hypothetical protein
MDITMTISQAAEGFGGELASVKRNISNLTQVTANNACYQRSRSGL